MKNYDDFKRELLKNKAIKNSYDQLEPEFQLAKILIEKRLARKMTQKQLAIKTGTKQSAISRLESGHSNPSFEFLQKIASALGGQLKISI
jgi:predicted transcriptional regulator